MRLVGPGAPCITGRTSVGIVRPPSRRRRSPLLAAALVAACGDGTTSPEPPASGAPGLSIVSGVAADTVQAASRVLVVVLRDSTGRPIPGAVLQFVTLDGAMIGVRKPAPRADGAGAVDTTDRNGRAEVEIAFGGEAGTARVVVLTGEVARRDTLRVTVRPGAPAAVRGWPADTAVYVGGTYVQRGQVLDRFDNPRPDSVTIAATSAGLTAAGRTLTAGRTPAREWVVVRAGPFVDTARVSVVPHGEMVTRSLKLEAPDATAGWVLVRYGLDGSGYRPVLLRTVGPPAIGIFRRDLNPSWAPALGTLLFHDEMQLGRLRVYRATSAGTAVPLATDPRADLDDVHPTLDATGTWLYFARGTTQQMDLYRSRLDGSAAERLTPEPSQWFLEDRHPAPSPDGRRVAYETNRRDGSGDGFVRFLRVLDLETRAVRALGIPGARPRWSPDGAWLAFVGDRAVRVVRPDGTGLRTVSAVDRQYELGVSWSPDGRWIAAARLNTGQVELIDVQTGTTLPLAFTRGTFEPVWLP